MNVSEFHAVSIFNLQMEASRQVSYHITTWCHNPRDHDINFIAVISSGHAK
jgi:hypothetical protein